MSDLTHTLRLKKPLAIFDLETTGVNIVRDRIVEISVVKALTNGKTEIKTRRINPEMPIPLESSLIHGIYDEDVKDAPTFKSIAKNLASFLEGCDMGGFNSNRFDIPLLVEEFLRVGVDFDMKNRKAIDAQRIFHMMEPRNLGAAYQFYCGKKLENAHSAEADTIATFEVLQGQINKYEGVKVVDADGNESEPIQNDMGVLHALTASNQIDFAGRMVFNQKGEEVFNFGKHKDKLVVEVLQKEPSFYDWMMKAEFPLDTKRRLTEIKLRALTQR
ncbi:DNA polymerase-3 subunit epsilon [Dyadobacter jejuensis]|uniref:DNA polymerase-3 subunit epsilon n=1 Tax=Dyadobacter jejuensis TaxID=1082580 RepID=A0A316A8D2_9BACT|nr:3'-5' exonuclease [Dyadobacter jejuensis]PWJ53230.1 DNA polymerase-3 subunit epsilon [Dyadobacter jejuensis]